jgi:hypothetical protein
MLSSLLPNPGAPQSKPWSLENDQSDAMLTEDEIFSYSGSASGASSSHPKADRHCSSKVRGHVRRSQEWLGSVGCKSWWWIACVAIVMATGGWLYRRHAHRHLPRLQSYSVNQMDNQAYRVVGEALEEYLLLHEQDSCVSALSLHLPYYHIVLRRKNVRTMRDSFHHIINPSIISNSTQVPHNKTTTVYETQTYCWEYPHGPELAVLCPPDTPPLVPCLSTTDRDVLFTMATQRYVYREVEFFSMDTQQRDSELLFGAEAFCLQHFNDLQNGNVDCTNVSVQIIPGE